MLDESWDVETVVVVADEDDDNDWLDDKSIDDDDTGAEVDASGDTDSVDCNVGCSMLDEWCDGETVVVVADGDDDNDWIEDKSNDDDDDDADDDDSGSEVDRLGDTDSVDSDGGSSMLDESCAVETVVVVADEDDDNGWLEDKSNEDDDTGTKGDTSGDTDSVDCDVGCSMLDEWCDGETVIDVDDDNDWLEENSNDDDDRGREVDRSGDTESIDGDVGWSMLDESCDAETVVLFADWDDDNDWLEDKSNDDDDDRWNEVDRSGGTDSIDDDVGWRMLDESCEAEIVVVVADGDDNNDSLEEKWNRDDDDDSGSEVDRSGDTDAVDNDIDWRMVGESDESEIVTVVLNEDGDSDWLMEMWYMDENDVR